MKVYLRAILSLAIAVPVMALAACDETIDATPAPDAGADATTTADAAADAAPSLFQRLGGEAGIAQLVDAIMAAELADPVIQPFFAPNQAATPPSGKPTLTQIKECLTKQIANAANPEIKYPTSVSGGYACRDMQSSHASLHISAAIFDKFAANAVNVATASGKISAGDLQTVGGFLSLQKTLIVDPNAGGDAGSDASNDSAADAPVDAPADGG